MAEEMFYIPSLSFSKLAVLAFYWRIFNSVRSAKISIIILAIIAILWLAVRVSPPAWLSALDLFHGDLCMVDSKAELVITKPTGS